MKKLAVLVLLGFFCAATVQAGVEFVGIDGVSTNYTANTGVLLMDSSSLVLTIDYDDGSPQGSIDPVSFILETTLDSGTNFVGGTFEIMDDSDASVILSGNVLTVDFTGAGSFLVGEGTAQVTTSNLTGYPVGPSEIVSITFNLSPSFTDFNRDYTGLSKVNLLVPEPTTLVLLGLGGLLLRKKGIR